MGPSATGTALDLLNRIRTNQVLECSGSTSAEELSGADSGGYFFRTVPPDRLQAVALARLVIASGKRRPAVVVRDDAYGEAFTRPLLEELRAGGAKPAGRVIAYDPEAEDLSDVGRTVADRKPDSVVTISLADDGARLVNALIAAGVGPNQLPVYAPDGMQNTDVRGEGQPGESGSRARHHRHRAGRGTGRARDRVHRRACAGPASRRSSPRTTTTARSSPRSPRCRRSPTTRRR